MNEKWRKKKIEYLHTSEAEHKSYGGTNEKMFEGG